MEHEVRHCAARTLRGVRWSWAALIAGCAASAPPVATQPDSASPIGNGELGAGTYRATCLPCHGEDGRGGPGGGAPLTTAREIRFVIDTVTYGQNNMPPFGGALTPDQIAAVSTYVVEHLAGD